MQRRSVTLIASVLFLACFAWLYRDVAAGLCHDWSVDDNYSHGFLIVPLAFYFAWERRQRLREVERRPHWSGLALAIASMGLLVAGVLGSELFVTRVSMLGVTGGALLFLYGWAAFKVMLFPLLFLLLMIPIPSIIFNQIAFPLQLLASRFGETALMACQVPVLREGNVMHLANTSLEVAEACSGIRSLISLLTLGIVYGYFTDTRLWFRLALAFATIPVAIFANGIRVAGTGIAAHFYGSEAAQGFFHSFSGWLVFLAAFVMLLVIQRLLSWFAPRQRLAAQPPSIVI